jgi:NarL family two-component system sensor histidine kinase LiaS
MRRFLTSFRRLQWKLTLSYTLVTVAALLVVEIVGLGLLQIFVLNTNTLQRYATQALVNSTTTLQPYFETDPPDIRGMNAWLQQLAVNGTTFTDEQGREVRLAPSTFSQGNGELFVLDARQQFLTALPTQETISPGTSFDTSRVPLLDQVLPRALAGETDPERLFAARDDGRFTVAAPVQAADGSVSGVLVFTATFPPQLQNISGQVLSLIGGSLIFLALSAGTVGTVFGWLTARGLSRRLGRLTRAADTWSRGDFTEQVADASGDELGQLTGHLNQMAEALRDLLATRQELASLEERNRLARDLHDSVKQQVFATAMQLGAARELIERDPQAAKAHLAEAEQLAHQAREELTALIRELRPAALEGKGLAEALRDHVAHWSRRNGVTAEMQVQGQRTSPLAVEQTLFRVAQEALTNVARHSGAAKVTVHLAYEKDAILLTIADNGQGFDPEVMRRKGVGLSSMRERMEALGGSLKMISQPGVGTRVIASCQKEQNK